MTTSVREMGQAWSPELDEEFRANCENGKVGNTLAFENDVVRVWLLKLLPGERLPFHRHVLTYFWTATSPGRILSRFSKDEAVVRDYVLGETKFIRFEEGQSLYHDAENVGDSCMTFTTVEFVGSPNRSLEVRPPFQRSQTAPTSHDEQR